jgi:hypothetical protein
MGAHEGIDSRQTDQESGRLLRAFTAEYRQPSGTGASA